MCFHQHGGFIGFGPETQPKISIGINTIWVRSDENQMIVFFLLTLILSTSQVSCRPS